MSLPFIFFGTDTFSTGVLNELEARGFLPSLIVTVPDKPKGRKLVMTPPDAKIWGEARGIPVIQLKTLRTPEAETEIREKMAGALVGIVASYGKIIPQNILDIPAHKTLNVHPSLLPKLRGASPLQSAILLESETGVTIMVLDADMDHGPILASQKTDDWSADLSALLPYSDELEKKLSAKGGALLGEILPDWVAGTITAIEQNHADATFTVKIKKEDGLLDLADSPEINLRKIRAYQGWPTAYYFDNEKRIIIKTAHIENGALVIDRIIPEGGKEMNYLDYTRSRN